MCVCVCARARLRRLNHIYIDITLLCFSHNDLTPMSNIEGPHIDYTYVLDYYRFHEQADFDNYIKRLIATPTQVRHHEHIF